MSDQMLSPKDAFSLWDTIRDALVNAAHEALWDFDHGDNKPWAYYPGVFTGVLANSAPGLGAVIYFIGSTIDVAFRKGPDASDITYYLDGISQGDLSAFAASEAWEQLHIGDLVEGVMHTLKLVNKTSATDPDNENIMGIGDVTVTGEYPRAGRFESEILADVWTLTLTIQDEKRAYSIHSLHLPVAAYEYDEAVYFLNDYAHRLDGLITGRVRRLAVNREFDGLPAPALSGSDVEQGLKITCRLDDWTKTHFTVPTWNESYLGLASEGKKSLDISDEDVVEYLNLLVNAVDEGYPANPCSSRGLYFVQLLEAYQVFRGR